MIVHKAGQGYGLATEVVSVDVSDFVVSVDVSDFEEAFAAAKAQADSADALRSVIDAYRGDLLDYADNPEAFTWVEREGLRVVQQKKVAWAAIALSEILRDRGCPQEVLDVLEPLLDSIVNDELWLQARRGGASAPRPRRPGPRDGPVAEIRASPARSRSLPEQRIRAGLQEAAHGRGRL